MLFRLLTAAAAAIGVLVSGVGMAQQYPTKPIRLVVGYPPGGGSDVSARIVATAIERRLGQSLVVENRPGAGGVLAARQVAQATPDGYTLLYTGATASQWPLLFKDLQFDPINGLAAVSKGPEFWMFLVSNGQVPVATVSELIAYTKANPGRINFASIARNSTMFAMEAFRRASGMNATEITYQGNAAFNTALLRNEVQLVATTVGADMKEHVSSGKVRALMVFGTQRSPQLPDVPSASELGLNLPGFGWFGLFAPKGTPKPILDRVSAEMRRSAEDAEVRKLIDRVGATMFASTPEEFQAQLQSDHRTWKAVADAIGLKPE